MTTINLKDLWDTEKNEIYQILLNANDVEFNIITECYRSEKDKGTSDWSFFVGLEYYDTLYIGHELFSIAETFAVYIPDTNMLESIRFEITIRDMVLFTEYLYYLLKGNSLDKINHPEKKTDLLILKQQFHDDILNNKAVTYNSFTAVHGILDLYNEWCDKSSL